MLFHITFWLRLFYVIYCINQSEFIDWGLYDIFFLYFSNWILNIINIESNGPESIGLICPGNSDKSCLSFPKKKKSFYEYKMKYASSFRIFGVISEFLGSLIQVQDFQP